MGAESTIVTPQRKLAAGRVYSDGKTDVGPNLLSSLLDNLCLCQPVGASWSSWPVQDGDPQDEELDSASGLRGAILRRLVDLIVSGSLRPVEKTSLLEKMEARLVEAHCDVTTREIREAIENPDWNCVRQDALGRYYAAQGWTDLEHAWSAMAEADALVDFLTETEGKEEHFSPEAVYLRGCGQVSRLSADEEVRLARLVVSGDMRARHRMIVANLRMAWYWARRYRGHGVDLLDLVQVANVGLIKAVNRFDASLGFAFATFASYTIKGEIARYFRDQTWCVRIPRGLKETNGRLKHLREDMTLKLRRPPTMNELAAAAGISATETIEALAIDEAREAASLQALHEEGPLAESVASDPRTALSEVCDMAVSRVLLESACAKLDARSRHVLYLRFSEDLTQEDIARLMDISQMHVSRLIRRSLEVLRCELADLG